MIPILYEATEVTFTSNGLGRLSDAISLIVTEERNGRFDLEMQYPVTGIHFDDITEGRIIGCTHDEEGDLQPFIIYQSSKPLDGIVTFNAYHFSYKLNDAVLKYYLDVWPKTAQDLMRDAAGASTTAGSAITGIFTFNSDIADLKFPDAILNPLSFRAFLGGSVLNKYGGEFEWDKVNVNLLQARGSNRGVTIKYGKNLADFKAETDFSGAYTHVYALYSGDDLDTKNDRVAAIVDSGQRLPGNRSAYQVVDFTSNITSGETKTAAQITTELQTLGANYAAAHKIWEPAVSIEVDFVQLWQTEEYKNIAPLLKCHLCDTVNVSFGRYGLADLAVKVVSVEWDALADRYQKMTLGGLATTLAESINSGVSGSIQANADAISSVNTRTWVSDVTVNGSSVVTDGVAAITNPSWSALTLTRTTNNYVNATNFARLAAVKLGKLGLIFVNLQFSTSMPTGTNETTIGTISGATIARQVLQTIPCQSNNSTIMLDITTAGNILVSNYSGTATGTNFFRAVVPMWLS